MAVALAGRNRDALDEGGHALRADYLRLLALGLPPAPNCSWAPETQQRGA
ncbi:hypothetical protein [Streptomyces sp. NPDC001494]